LRRAAKSSPPFFPASRSDRCIRAPSRRTAGRATRLSPSRAYLGRCLAAQAPATTLVIADCDNAADQAFGVEELDPDHRVRLHLAGQCVGAQAMATGAAVRLEPCSDDPTQIFALDGDSIILDAKPELVVRLSNAITKPGTPVALGERWLGDDELWDFVPPAGAVGRPTRGFVTVSDSMGFVTALAAAGANTVIQLTPGAELDFQDLNSPFEIPAGVTVRGSRRGSARSSGPRRRRPASPGFSSSTKPRSRITGLRIRGPGRDPNGKMPPMKGVNVVAVSSPAPNRRIYLRAIVDHNDISDWGVSAVDLQGPDDDDVVCPLAPQIDPGFVRILGNYIHDNRENHYANAKGYGLAAGSGADPLVFANVFQKNGMRALAFSPSSEPSGPLARGTPQLALRPPREAIKTCVDLKP
jgi:hypothetical protein